MASFSLFPKIESEEDRQRRQARRLTKSAEQSAQNAVTASNNATASAKNLELASVPYSSIVARVPPTMQEQPETPELVSQTSSESPPLDLEKATKPVSHKLRTVASSPGLYSPPSPPPMIPAHPEIRQPSRKTSAEIISPAVSSSDSQSPITASTATSPISSRKHTSVSTTGTAPSPATATSPQFSFSPSLIKSASQSVVYPTVPTAQSPIIKSSPRKEDLFRRQSILGPLPPPPPFPPRAGLARSNTSATHRSDSTMHTMRSAATQSTTHTVTSRSTAKPVRAATAPAPRSIFPVFDPSRPLIEQQHFYYPPYNPAAGSSRPLTMKNLKEAEHAFAAPPKHRGPQSNASGITSASTARTLIGPPGTYPASPERKRPQQGAQPQHQLSRKQSVNGITTSTAVLLSSSSPRPSTSSGVVNSNSGMGRAKHGELPEAVQSGVAAAFGACAFVIGVGVEVVGGAVGGLKKGVRKEREKKERRDEKRADKARQKAASAGQSDSHGVGYFTSARTGAESPGWVVGDSGGSEKRVVDFRI